MKRLFSLFLSVIATCVAFTLTACSSSDGLKTVKVNEVTHSVFYAPMHLADSLGYFGEEGLKIELTAAEGSNTTMSAVLSGDADIGLAGPETAIYVALGGASDAPKIFGQLTKRDGSFILSRESEPNFEWSDLENKEILVGRTGGMPSMTIEYVLNGLDIYDGVNVQLNYDVSFGLMAAAFDAGTADYCTMFEPVASDYQAAGKGYIVASVGEDSGEVPYTCFIAKQSYISSNTEVIKSFLRAVTRARKYISENTAEAVAQKLTGHFPATSEALLASAVARYKSIDAWMSNLAMKPDSFERLQDIIENAGQLSARANFNDIVINDYAQAVYTRLYGE